MDDDSGNREEIERLAFAEYRRRLADLGKSSEAGPECPSLRRGRHPGMSGKKPTCDTPRLSGREFQKLAGRIRRHLKAHGRPYEMTVSGPGLDAGELWWRIAAEGVKREIGARDRTFRFVPLRDVKAALGHVIGLHHRPVSAVRDMPKKRRLRAGENLAPEAYERLLLAVADTQRALGRRVNFADFRAQLAEAHPEFRDVGTEILRRAMVGGGWRPRSPRSPDAKT